MRLGMIGMDSSRPLRVARHLHGLVGSGHALELIVHEGDDLPPGLRELAPDAEIVGEPRDAIGRVDAVFDLARRASARRERIAPLLRSGIHAFVDKPIALTRADAGALIEEARASGAALASDSGFRLAVERADVREGAAIEVSGPADPESPWGGLAFYGMHHAQIADELGRDPDAVVDAVVRDGVVTARADSPAGAVRMVFDPAASGFSLTVDGESRALTPPADYLERLVDHFLSACAAPVHDQAWEKRLLRPVGLLQDITAALEAAEGAPA